VGFDVPVEPVAGDVVGRQQVPDAVRTGVGRADPSRLGAWRPGFAAGLGLGWWVSARKSWLWLLNGSLLGAVLFYLITNTLSWSTDAFYAKTLAGWWQALTVGHPEYPPTIFFFRNTLFGDLLFTGLFAGVMEWIAHTQKEPNLIDGEDGEKETEDEGEPVKEKVPAE